MKLHDYWRSGAAYRVRIALNLKGLAYEAVPHDLTAGAHRAADYAAVNPQKLIPALEADGQVLTQSLAILEWLEERHPAPPLLPSMAGDRAIVRAMAGLMACDIHPLHNLRVQEALRSEFGASQEQVSAWIARWMGEGLEALEQQVARYGGRYAFGDTPTFADCCLVSQLYSAQRFGVPVDRYPRLVAAGEAARALPAVAAAHPDLQPRG
jgi:maleylpyruvate isomerase